MVISYSQEGHARRFKKPKQPTSYNSLLVLEHCSESLSRSVELSHFIYVSIREHVYDYVYS